MLGAFLRDVIARQRRHELPDLRPDETASNRLGAVYEATDKAWDGRDRCRSTSTSARDGRVMEILSEHTCQGWLEGYLLTGRHGLFSCYEAFIHIVDSMFNQHAKWLKTTREHPVAAADRLAQLPADLARVAPGPQRLLATRTPASSTTSSTRRPRSSGSTCRRTPTPCCRRRDHCLRSRDYVNVIVAGKQPALDWLDMEQAILHCTRGVGIWEWASTRRGGDARRRDRPAPATCRRWRRWPPSSILREHLPELKVRFVNVVDLMRLQDDREHPHGLSRPRLRHGLHPDKPVIFAYHGYPWLIHRLTYRPHQPRQHPRARLQGGGHHDHAVRHGDDATTSTASTWSWTSSTGCRGLGDRAAHAAAGDGRQAASRTARARATHGEDLPEVRDWQWAGRRPARAA